MSSNTLCDHPEQRIWEPMEAVRWCTNCGAIRLPALDDGWTQPGDPDQPMAYMDTVSGKQICLLDPRPEDVDLDDIAHHLAMQVRFNGGIPRFYGVGEHSSNVALGVYYRLGGRDAPVAPTLLNMGLPIWQDPRRFWGTILRAGAHDASEGYLGDCIKPLKNLLPFYRVLEQRHMRAVHTALGFGDDEDWTEADAIIGDIDNAMFRFEQYVLRRGPETQVVGVPTLECWDWQTAKGVFLDVMHRAQRGFAAAREVA